MGNELFGDDGAEVTAGRGPEEPRQQADARGELISVKEDHDLPHKDDLAGDRCDPEHDRTAVCASVH